MPKRDWYSTVSTLLIYGNGGIPIGTIPTVVDEKEDLDFVKRNLHLCATYSLIKKQVCLRFKQIP
jgi:hypothetical protein